MNFPTVRFVFDRKKVATSQKAVAVSIVITHNRERRYFDTGIRLFAGQWNEKSHVVKRADASELNKRLDSFVTKIQGYFTELVQNERDFSFAEFSNFIEANKRPSTFLKFVEDRILHRADIRESTRRTQKKLITSLNEFNRLRTFSDVTRPNIVAYDAWLHEKGEMAQSTIHSYHKFLKTYIHEAMRRELIKIDPYVGFSVPRGKSSKRKYLTEIEVKRLQAAEIKEKCLARARDLFVFQCYTGLAYADLCNFDFSKVETKTDPSGKVYYFISDCRVKSGVEYKIMILAPAVAILERYDFKLPVISNQKYNSFLKKVAALADIKTNLTSHVGRHTFATLCLNKGIKIEAVSKMLGHTNIQTTQLYAKLVNETLEQAFYELDSKI